MSDCRFGVSPVNYPDPDPDPDVIGVGWVRWWRVIGVVWVGRVWCGSGEGRDWDMGWGACGIWLVGGCVRMI